MIFHVSAFHAMFVTAFIRFVCRC